MERRLPWGVYLALWAFGFLLAVSWLPLWGYGSEAIEVWTFWEFLNHIPKITPKALPYLRGILWANAGPTLAVLAIGTLCGALRRWLNWEFDPTRKNTLGKIKRWWEDDTERKTHPGVHEAGQHEPTPDNS